MSILQMLTKEAPYKECEALGGVGAIYQRVTQHVPPASLHTIALPSARAFIDVCLDPNPALRPSAAELLEHVFLKEDKEVDALDVVLTAAPEEGGKDGGEGEEKGKISGGRGGGGEGGRAGGREGGRLGERQTSTDSAGIERKQVAFKVFFGALQLVYRSQ
ncbi:putative serine threonine-protein kinase wnk11 [Nannochloropsis gaditana]|uniref:Putative serine threonine-protein kinase wnk11 n=1 Tax=Nannochloropsis gaditana TaxID=72520 RepID=W7TS48_9STRA|nr:putative serine threonine-protein kinase wnk11 [Nannochloropsis gaditana]